MCSPFDLRPPIFCAMVRVPLGRWMGALVTACVVVACGDDGQPSGPGRDASVDAAGADTGPVDGGQMPSLISRPVDRARCRERDPLRRPLFGDLHVHTRFSFDAASYDVRTGPREAYRFARGEEIALPPYDSDGAPTRRLRLERPLDFAAVTDHAELMAATSLCTDPSSAAYGSDTCESYRDSGGAAGGFGSFFFSIALSRPTPVLECQRNPELCERELADVWGETIDAAEEFDDRSEDCNFSTFIAYEWTGAARGFGRNIHRNVIFGGSTVLRRPVSYVDAHTPERFWNALEANCLNADSGDAPGCDVLAIPHNSNIAVGNMFYPMTEAGEAYDRDFAERRAALEPLVEIYQHKGSSECVRGVQHPLASEDELCAFELFQENFCEPGETENCTALCEGRDGLSFVNGCVAPADYVRGALRTGLQEYARIGANPFQLGFIASSDTHASLAGSVEEHDWQGHTGNTDDDAEERLGLPEGVTIAVRTSSPGGLAAVWAEENSRPAIFEALRRRETYGTSGPRIALRFFGGWQTPEGVCGREERIAESYDAGVPMGGVLPPAPSDASAPRFWIGALQDALGAPLQRIQIIKGGLDAAGESYERVYEIAGDPMNGATVDLATCEPEGEGAASLCGFWEDPDFDPATPAFYYARAVENPTCRWSQRLCLAESVDCDSVDPTSALAACCDGSVPPTVQERAWASPIWYLPGR